MSSGLITQEQLDFALRENQRTGIRVGQILTDRNIISETALYGALAKLSGLPRLDLATVVIEREASSLADPNWCVRYGMIPVRVDLQRRTLELATSDPTNIPPIDEIAFRTSMTVRCVVGSEGEINRLIRHIYFGEPLDRSEHVVDMSFLNREVEEADILHDMSEVREAVQATADGGRVEDEALRKLKPLFEGQQEAARALQAIFELCVRRGILSAEEYVARLKASD
jgi:type IV pilus assembly protein PilB